jgi:Na+-driven multidrug efflux pump
MYLLSQIGFFILLGVVAYLVSKDSPAVYWIIGAEYSVLFIFGIIWMRKKLRNQKGKEVHNGPKI